MAVSGTGAREVTATRRFLDCGLFGGAGFALGLILAAHPVSSAAASSDRTPSGMAGCADRIYDRLFFGLGMDDGTVSDSDWRRFLREVVTPRFPSGLTIVEANGQWRALGEREVTVERSRVVEIAHDDSRDFDRRLSEIIGVYKQRHRQRSVMLTRARVEVCW